METVCILHFLQELIQCSYRTYEEWKLKIIKEEGISATKVLTVPMRNGNYIFHQYVSMFSTKFLPYL